MEINITSLLTQYDQAQSGKRGHSPYALPLYLQAVHDWENDPRTATDPIGILSEYFTHNPADARDFCLKPVRQFVREYDKA
jgi:hypothetical protein